MSPESRKLLNIIILGIGFMFMFTAFQTSGNVAQTVISSLNSTSFHGSGYTSLAIIYSVFSASNLIAPSIVAVIGCQMSMFLSGLLYSAYIAMFIQPYTWSFYTLSVLIGIAAAVLWTAQGSCLTINSDDTTIGKHSGIFWALLQFSMLFGNLFIYLAWKGEINISDSDRRTVFIALTVISLVGSVLFFLIRTPESDDAQEDDISNSAADAEGTIVFSFGGDIYLMIPMWKFIVFINLFISGLELTFYSGVYGTCIGSMKVFEADAKSLIGLSGIFVGLGEVLGGGLFGLLGKYNYFGRNPVVILGVVVHFLAFYMIYLYMPSDAPIASREGTYLRAFINPSKTIALACSFLLGLGDSCYNTQMLSILGSLYPDNSAPAFAVFKFVQSVSAAVAFFYSNYLLLHWQLLILVIFGFFGTISFFFVEWGLTRRSQYNSM
uniref:UNC93-like protein MFSD11 n=1 Tax=Xenopus tropicalis TaxID=8364 RepID=A0A5S6N6X4_XENTR